ncbi:hypothetical protein A3Q56_04186 [Intoshia linei]|uniref:CH-like domain-containing protein n=1 Tax=Intoshia linei TaxID=1819745 RepID=A0A177B1R3_9BILA|nr:hypothetical protein A3Q56_04186 [Intoshia linei]
MFIDGKSFKNKLKNWSILNKFIKKHNIYLPENIIYGTIHSKDSASVILVENIFKLLTNRKIKQDKKYHTTDEKYQELLPPYAKTTTSKSIKNNITITEIIQIKNIQDVHKMTHKIIEKNQINRQRERIENPKRFDIKKTLPEKCYRNTPTNSTNIYTNNDYIETLGFFRPIVKKLH